MNIDGNRIQLLLTRWNYKGYHLISMNISDLGYELIAATTNSNGVKVMEKNLDEAVECLAQEIDKITEAEYKKLALRIKQKFLTGAA